MSDRTPRGAEGSRLVALVGTVAGALAVLFAGRSALAAATAPADAAWIAARLDGAIALALLVPCAGLLRAVRRTAAVPASATTRDVLGAACAAAAAGPALQLGASPGWPMPTLAWTAAAVAMLAAATAALAAALSGRRAALRAAWLIPSLSILAAAWQVAGWPIRLALLALVE